MHVPTRDPDSGSVIEVDVRPMHCIVVGCGGEVVRHCLGPAQATFRCTRCFRRYHVRPAAAPIESPRRLRRFLSDLVSWRDDD
jgi:hypothetical protein